MYSDQSMVFPYSLLLLDGEEIHPVPDDVY